MNTLIIVNGKQLKVNLSYMKLFLKAAKDQKCKVELLRSWPYEHASRIVVTKPDGSKSMFFFEMSAI